ncbi:MULTISPECIES: hypothetical protein [Streptomyces violaceusniger group]|uniref:Toxin-antitoxin system HicB family antitoxin n=2 Tax=Streptomyces javensis TaxID=114698 RepID=A0ABS0RAR0_9ACTN|nr:hypothetical protein [Streptomyces javensis]MBI0314495.1 hypothetical protein [Streptomyces javensis]
MTDESGRKARQPRQRKQMLLRLDPAVHDALARWANDELRSANAQIEFLLRKALADAGRLPGAARPIPRRGRPPRRPAEDAEGTDPSEGPEGAGREPHRP